MARRVAFFAGLAALALAGLIASVPSVRGAEGSGTFVVITDFHFNPFAARRRLAARIHLHQGLSAAALLA